jgi:hypothetical protein
VLLLLCEGKKERKKERKRFCFVSSFTLFFFFFSFVLFAHFLSLL